MNANNKPQQIAEYSVDYDMTLVIRYVFRLFGFLLGMLFALEVTAIVTNLLINKKLPESPSYLTSELVHTLIGFAGGWCGNIVTNFFAKMIGEKLANAKSIYKTQGIDWTQ